MSRANTNGVDTAAQAWLSKTEAANKFHRKWSDKYKTDALEEYYEGFQWADDKSDGYTLNLFYATIESKEPGMLFTTPKFNCTPKAAELAKDPDSAYATCQNLEDTINTVINQDYMTFGEEIQSAIHDTWFRFGVVEVGYSANWIDNPNVSKPELKSDYDNTVNSFEGNNVKSQPEKLPTNERIYIKYVPARNFRVSSIDSRYLHRSNWCGYFEYVRLEDLLANPLLKKVDQRGFEGFKSEEYSLDEHEDRDSMLRSGDYVLIWKIWDNRSKKRYIISETHQKILYTAQFSKLPFATLRPKRRLKTWYPIPPTFNWISPQNEINEGREANRNHRRRFKRIYALLKNACERDEAEKLIAGPDGGIIEVDRENALMPIANADLGSSASISLQLSKDDFNIISATSSEERGQVDRQTATAATITNQKSQVRETAERLETGKFHVEIAKLILQIIKKQFVNDFAVSSTQYNSLLETEKKTSRSLNPITDLGDKNFGYDLVLSVDSVSPVTNDEELNKMLKFLALLNQYSQFALSPFLIRELAFRCGYRNERAIQEFQKMAQLQMIGMMEQGMKNLSAMGQGPQPGGNTQAQQMQTPGQAQIQNQLDEQLQIH